MAEFASHAVGNAGLVTGVIGTALGVLNGGLGILGGGNGMMNLGRAYETTYATQHDLDDVKTIAQKDSEIARLNAKIYSDEADIAVYKQVRAEIKELSDLVNAKNTEQAVINATVNSGLTTLSAQVRSVTDVVNSITKTAVPTSAICNFGCGCSSCSQM